MIGRLLGWQLSKEGFAVSLYERDAQGEPSSSSHVAASMLAPLSEYPDCEPGIWQLAQTSLAAWPAILDELGVPYAIDGSVVVAHAQDASLLGKFRRTLDKAELQGIRDLSASQLAAMEPELAGRFTSGLLLEGEGWLDNRCLLDRLESRCGEIHFNTEIDPAEMTEDIVIDCRGGGDGDPELRGVRGEAIRIRAPEVNLQRPIRLMHPKYQLYVSPRPNAVYVVGATQIESDAATPMTVRSALELLSAAYTIHSGFAEAEILELNVGVRPAFPDNLPRVRWRDGVLQVNGLYRHGFLVAPATVSAAIEEVNSVCKYSSTAIQ